MRWQTVLSLFISITEIFSNPTAFTVINNYAKGGVVQISTVLVPVHHAARQSVLWNRIFLDIYLSTFFGVRNFRNKWARRVFFFGKCSKFNVDFKNAKKNWQKVSCFSDNCIWFGCLKLSPLRREYVSWAVNALANSVRSFHINMRDFFQPNCLHSDQ